MAIVIVVFAFGALALVTFRSSVLAALAPLWRGESAIGRGARNFFTILRDKESLAEENLALKERLISYDALLTENRTLESSRDELLSSFGRAEAAPGIAAGVLVHPPLTPYDILVVDAGVADGVKAGDAVSLPEGGAIGKVVEAEARESQVDLYSRSGRETPAFLERGDMAIVLVGAGGGSFKFTLPRESAVEVGDKILLPGIRSELVGVVREVTLEPTDAEKHILVSAPANIQSIRFVLIH